MSEWKEYTIGDLVTFQRGHDLPREKMKDGIYPVAGSNSVIGLHNSYTTEAPGITIGRSGNIGNPQLHKTKFWAHNTTLYVKEFKKVDPTFFYYLLKTLDFSQLNSGSAVPSLNRNFIHPFKVSIPNDVITQRGIVEILSSLDDKIELNNKINQELESLAQLLFKRWFVDFEFPNENGEPYKSSGGEMVDSELGEIPKGWHFGILGELVNVINGYAFKSKDFNSSLEEGIVKIKNINGITVDIVNTDFVSSNVTSKLNSKFKIISGDILIAMTGAEVGKIGVVAETKKNLWLNQRVGKLVPEYANSLSFIHNLYNTLNLTDIVRNEAMGSAQPNISSTGIEAIKILIPDKVLIENFANVFNEKYFLFVSSLAEIQVLSELRDTLLPKLISGELQINEN